MAISVIRHCSTYNVGTLSEILELHVIKILRVMTVEIQPLKVYSKGSNLSDLLSAKDLVTSLFCLWLRMTEEDNLFFDDILALFCTDTKHTHTHGIFADLCLPLQRKWFMLLYLHVWTIKLSKRLDYLPLWTTWSSSLDCAELCRCTGNQSIVNTF